MPLEIRYDKASCSINKVNTLYGMLSDVRREILRLDNEKDDIGKELEEMVEHIT